jgi:hypothetical protein
MNYWLSREASMVQLFHQGPIPYPSSMQNFFFSFSSLLSPREDIYQVMDNMLILVILEFHWLILYNCYFNNRIREKILDWIRLLNRETFHHIPKNNGELQRMLRLAMGKLIMSQWCDRDNLVYILCLGYIIRKYATIFWPREDKYWDKRQPAKTSRSNSKNLGFSELELT